jgi:hypothetical protein
MNNLPNCVELITEIEASNRVRIASQFIHVEYLSDLVLDKIRKVLINDRDRNGYVISFNHFSIGSLCVIDHDNKIYNIPLK